MRTNKNLTDEQKAQLAILEAQLQSAADTWNYEKAKSATIQIQHLLRPTGHETRLMKAKNQLFEIAMESGKLSTAVAGFIGIRQKVSNRTRLYLEATTLLAICHLRERDLASARPYMIEAFVRVKNIVSPDRQAEYRIGLAQRFDDEALLASLSSNFSERLDVEKIQEEAGRLIYSTHEDDILELLGASVPEGARDFIRDVHKESQGLLTYAERKKLPSPAAFEERKKLGKGVLSAFRTVIWRSLCDKESEVYKIWFTNGMQAVLDRKYITASVVSALSGLRIGVYAIAVYLTALLIKIGIETFCTLYRPTGIMTLRR